MSLGNNATIEPEKIDYENVGKWIKRIRKKRQLKQEEVAKIMSIDRSVLSRYENGVVMPKWDQVVKLANVFNENIEELRKKVSVAIPDTCALLKNQRLLHILLEDYDQVVIPTTVIIELSGIKNDEEKGLDRIAWQVLANIDFYSTEYPERFKKMDSDKFKKPDSIPERMLQDFRIISLARELAAKTIGDVVIITDDVDITTTYDKAIRIDDYIAKRTKVRDYEDIIDLDNEYRNVQYYQNSVRRLNLDAYLPDGMTLLISCIRCRRPEKTEQLGRLPSEKEKYKKLQFLIDKGADVNRNDNARYCLPPISHCIQIDDWKAFQMLLNAGCDYNKASRDERTASYMKVGKLNEGNTPLMIACWHARKKYVERLCEYPDISLNQQDSNGYTALIKCAVQRYKRKKENKPYTINEQLYRFLKERGADVLIRDRNNHTAEDWWNRGNDFNYKGDEQW